MSLIKNRLVLAQLECFFALLIACGYSSRNEPDSSNRSHMGGSLMLSPEELESMKEAGAAGDGRAAYLVFQHYSFGLNEPSRAQPWLEKSAAAGFPAGIRSLEKRKEIRKGDD